MCQKAEEPAGMADTDCAASVGYSHKFPFFAFSCITGVYSFRLGIQNGGAAFGCTAVETFKKEKIRTRN